MNSPVFGSKLGERKFASPPSSGPSPSARPLALGQAPRPPPTASGARQPFPRPAAQPAGDNPSDSVAPKDTPLWHASKHNFAPRVGIAYVVNNTPGKELVVRGAGGIFYGLGNQQGAQGTLGFP